jgi:type II secretory pathway pseudopilin PulG
VGSPRRRNSGGVAAVESIDDDCRVERLTIDALVGPCSGTREQGETLIELLMAVLILGFVGVAAVGGITTSVLVSDYHKKQAIAGAYVRDYAEAIEDGVAAFPTTNYDGTSSATHAPNAYKLLYSAPSGYTAQTPTVYCVSGLGVQTLEPCTDTGVQLVSLEVDSTDTRAKETLNVILRRPCRPLDSDDKIAGTAC